MRAASLQSCPTLCDPMAVVHRAPLSMGILQARILEWVAMPSSRGSSQPRDRIHISYVSCIGRQLLQCWSPWESCWCPHTSYSGPAAPAAVRAPDHTWHRRTGRGRSQQRALWKCHAGSALLGAAPVASCSCGPQHLGQVWT